MLTRRRLVILAGSLAILSRFVPPSPASAQSPDQAAAFIKQTGEALAAIANGPGSPQDRKSQLAAVVERTVDVDGVARFSLGRFWRAATPEQQRDYLAAFHAVLANNITGHLGAFRGVAFTMGRTAPREGDLAVGTVVTRPNTAPANVQWVVGQVGGQQKIVDVIAEGTSLRLTQRSDYASFLARNGNDVGRLIEAMRRNTAAAG